MKVSLGLLIGGLFALETVTALRGEGNAKGDHEVARQNKKKKSKSGADKGADCDEDITGFYRGLDGEDASIQSLIVECGDSPEDDGCTKVCEYSLIDTSFSSCGGLPGYGKASDAGLEFKFDLPMSVWCGGFGEDKNFVNPDFTIDFGFGASEVENTDSFVIQRLAVPIQYWPVQK